MKYMGLLIKNITMIDVESKKEVHDTDILVEESKIKKIGKDLASGSHEVIDGTGKYLIPGLIDSHMHFFQSSGIFTRPDVIDLRKIMPYEEEQQEIRQNLPSTFLRYLSCGVTGVVDCGGPFWNFEVKKQGDQSSLAPEIEVAGPLISTVSREILDLGDPPIIKTASKEEAIELAKKCATYDPAFVKSWFIYLPDSFDSDSEIIKAGIEETKRLGLKSAVHATELETARRAVNFGADILVHSVMNEEVDDEFISLLREKGVIYIPTLVVSQRYIETFKNQLSMNDFERKMGDPKYFRDLNRFHDMDSATKDEYFKPIIARVSQDPTTMNAVARKNIKRLHDAGVIIATGTDAGNIGTLHGPSVHREMEEMVISGLSPMEVLVASTKNPALVMNRKDLGVIKEGFQADLVILSENPVEKISNATKIDTVIKSGKVLTERIKPNN